MPNCFQRLQSFLAGYWLQCCYDGSGQVETIERQINKQHSYSTLVAPKVMEIQQMQRA